MIKYSDEDFSKWTFNARYSIALFFYRECQFISLHSLSHILLSTCYYLSLCCFIFPLLLIHSGHSNIHIAPAWISLKLPLQIPKSITDANESLAVRQSVFWTPSCHQKSHHHFFTCSCGTQLCLAGPAFAWSVRFAVQRRDSHFWQTLCQSLAGPSLFFQRTYTIRFWWGRGECFSSSSMCIKI